MVGKINMKQLRRQEERAKKKAATREMDQQQCTEYFEQGSKGDSAASTKGINRKGKGKEEKKKRDREEEDNLPTLSWHGELESDSISFPVDLETAYETLQMKPSNDASEVVEDLLDKLGHLSFHSYHEAVEASSILGESCHSFPWTTLLIGLFVRLYTLGTLRSHRALRFCLLRRHPVHLCPRSQQVPRSSTSTSASYSQLWKTFDCPKLP